MNEDKKFNVLPIALGGLIVLVIALVITLVVVIMKDDSDNEVEQTKPNKMELAKEINDGLTEAAKSQKDEYQAALEGEKKLGKITIGGQEVDLDQDEDVYEKARETATQMEIKSFNAQFTPYEGNRIAASQVRSLISTVNASNASTSDHIISVLDNSGESFNLSSVNSTKRYQIEFTKYDADGYICEITIHAND